MKKLIHGILIICFMFYISAGQLNILYAQSAKKTIAILNMEAKGGVSPSEAATLTDRLRTELVNLNTFTVLERGQMNAILDEQGFSQAGCTTSECAVEAGRMLGVQQMVAGDIGKIGDVLTIDVRVFDVQTGRIVKALQYDHKGTATELLALIKKIARQVSGLQVEEKKSFPWLWVGIGVAVLGGTIAAVVLSGGGGDGDEPVTQTLPDPVWPPN